MFCCIANYVMREPISVTLTHFPDNQTPGLCWYSLCKACYKNKSLALCLLICYVVIQWLHAYTSIYTVEYIVSHHDLIGFSLLCTLNSTNTGALQFDIMASIFPRIIEVTQMLLWLGDHCNGWYWNWKWHVIY